MDTTEKRIVPEELDNLIQEYLSDGIISDKERKVLLNKAQALGLNIDEVDLYIDAQQQKADQSVAAAVSKRRGKTCPYCGESIPELTDKCPYCGKNITPEASEELEKLIYYLQYCLERYIERPRDGRKAKVESYIRKAKMYYGNNPKVQCLVEETENSIKERIAEIKKQSRNVFIGFACFFLFSFMCMIPVFISENSEEAKAQQQEINVANKQIDSLNRLNQNLTAENTRIKGQYNEATRQIEGLNTERATLSEKVAIAAQLDATGISMQLKNKRGKATDKTSKCTNIQVNFTIAKNVTAQNGQKTFYVRITTPAGTTLGGGGSFNYQNRSLEATMHKTVEYGGQEMALTTYWNVSQSLLAGTYQVSISADGNMIGSRSFTFK